MVKGGLPWWSWVWCVVLVKLCSGASTVRSSGDGGDSVKNPIPVLYSTSGIDKEFQLELFKSVFASLRDLDVSGDTFTPDFIDVSQLKNSTLVAQRLWTNSLAAPTSLTLISLLSESHLSQIASEWDRLVSSNPTRITRPVKIYTPRLIGGVHFPPSVVVSSVQMGRTGASVALLNRVAKVGINALIPVLDGGDVSQVKWLDIFEQEAGRLGGIGFTDPIFIQRPDHLATFREMLDKQGGIRGGSGKKRFGVLLLARNGSRLALRAAGEREHVQMGWFSPDILEHEEWAYGGGEEGDESRGRQRREIATNVTTVNAHFGLYTVNFVGSGGWDNPTRRRMLRELTKYTGASPRILTSVLAYDTAALAVEEVTGGQISTLPPLSGGIHFSSQGQRSDGVYFGVSAVPELTSQSATLLQPSTWILEDTISLKRDELQEEKLVISDFQVATSSLLTGSELRMLANKTRIDVGCSEYVMNLITHDPFNQMPYNYYFKEENLPENLLIPNQHGFGITFLCFHGSDNVTEEPLTTTLQVACTPGAKISEPIKCFRSEMKLRQKRSPVEVVDSVPATQYQYGFGQVNDNNWNLPQNSKWSNPKEDANNNNYYYQSYNYPSTPAPANKRLDSSVSAASEVSTTPAPAPAPTSNLPELRQILKAAKPFVGSCIGSTTGCAMCVLVLGRLPLGAVPAACTGPCFVGTFGSCGALLGRVFSETTVICTELFRQGLMDPETFMADVEFGRLLHDQFPTTMQGYTLLATPLVDVMKTSPLITRIVSFFALPWAHHMKFLAGRTSQPSIGGLLIHTLGFPLCNIAGYLDSIYHEYSNHYYSNYMIGWSTFFSIVALAALIILTILDTRKWKMILQYNTIFSKKFWTWGTKRTL